jgi:hypothetical protein
MVHTSGTAKKKKEKYTWKPEKIAQPNALPKHHLAWHAQQTS